jgi:hypothetical protein
MHGTNSSDYTKWRVDVGHTGASGLGISGNANAAIPKAATLLMISLVAVVISIRRRGS